MSGSSHFTFGRIIAVASALALGAPAFAVDSGANAAQAPAAAPAASGKSAKTAEKRICKLVERTGSRLNARLCHTEAEWKKIESEEF